MPQLLGNIGALAVTLVEHVPPGRIARLPEDWYVHVDGQCCGYVYRCTAPTLGYAIGVGPTGDDIQAYDIQANKQAAVVEVMKQLTRIFQS